MIVFTPIVTLLTVFLLTPLVRWIALRLQVEDIATESRKIHRGTIPTMGGMAIYSGIMVGIVTNYWFSPEFTHLIDNGFWAVLLGASALCLTGAIDDAVGLNFAIKFALQVAIAVFTVVFGEHCITEIWNPFGENLVLIEPFSSILTVLWIVGICNAVNLVDGLDGLAAGVVGIGAATMLIVSLLYGNDTLALGYGALAGALFGFLRYNFNPATIFMGDTGALHIGYLMACLLLFHSPSAKDELIWIQALVLGFPIVDTLLAPVRRGLSGSHPFKADKEHIHHRLMFFTGLSHKHTVLCLYSVTIMLCAAALLAVLTVQTLGRMGTIVVCLIGTAVVILGAVGLKRLGYFTTAWQLPTVQHFRPKRQRIRYILNRILHVFTRA